MKRISARHLRRLSRAVACGSVPVDRFLRVNDGSEAQKFQDQPVVADFEDAQSTCDVPENVEVCDLNSSYSYSDIAEDLIEWKHEENISLQALTSLLKILKKQPQLNFLPSDARTLLRTPRSTTLIDVAPGKYYHFGLEEGLLSSVEEIGCWPEKLEFDINIDGLPLTKSSNSQFWVLQGNVVGLNSPFAIGIYHGYTKPSSAKILFEPFIEDYHRLQENGIDIGIDRKVPVSLRCIVCDAPAKAFVLNTTSHNSFNGCHKCQQRGKYIHRRVVYSSSKGDPRLDEDFENLSYEDHQLGHSPLAGLGIGLVSQTVLDYMHVVGLGVTKKLLTLWTHGRNSFRISSNLIIAISGHLLKLRVNIPAEFHRKPRPLSEFKRWKFTELRTFLLYTSIVVLKSRLQKELYDHYLALFCAIFILVTPNATDTFVDYAQELINYFVQKFKVLYGREYMSYNLHALLHICEDAKAFGPLDSFSATKFENNLQKIKKFVKGNNNPLPQIVRRFSEGSFKVKTKAEIGITCEQKHEDGPTGGSDCSGMFRKLKTQRLIFSTKTADCYCQTKTGEILIILNILETVSGVKLVVKQLLGLTDFFQSPCKSSVLGIYRADLQKTSPISVINFSDVLKKYVRVPFKQSSHVLIPLIHS